ncbi:MAG: hypothetical protein AAF997_05895 [Myxococcota bacterium]
MKTLNLSLFLSLIVALAGCSDDGNGGGTGGDAGSGGDGGTGAAGAGGDGGAGGTAGSGGDGGTGGMGGAGADGGSGGSGGTPQLLSEWGLFSDIENQIPEDGVVPYDVTAPLFTDDAMKLRFLQIPDGETIEYSDTARWIQPDGAIYVKTFAYPVDARDPELGLQLIETRIIEFTDEGEVDMWTYVYPEGENDDAELVVWGPTFDVSYINELGETVEFNYAVPSVPACRNCHSPPPRSRTLGPSSGMLNTDKDYGGEVGVQNQVDYLNSLGLFDTTPSEDRNTYVTNPTTEDTAGLHDRVRSYLDSNCSHCHARDGEVADKGLYLMFDEMDPETSDPFTWGVCKTPTSAGNGTTCDQGLDIVPGDPDASLFLCRLESVSPGELMPPLGRTTVHTKGAELVREWIEKMPEIFPDIPDCL